MGRQGAELSILVVRSGGFAGITRRWLVEPDADADGWIALVEACPWRRTGADPVSRDRFVWRIEARTPRRRRTASVPDRELIGPWRELVDRVQAEGHAPDRPPDGSAGDEADAEADPAPDEADGHA